MIKRSVYVECRQWHDRVNGNTYYSARVYVDGAHVFTTGRSYGYDFQYEHDVAKQLVNMGYLPEEYGSRGIRWARELGIDVYSVCYDAKKRDLWEAEGL